MEWIAAAIISDEGSISIQCLSYTGKPGSRVEIHRERVLQHLLVLAWNSGANLSRRPKKSDNLGAIPYSVDVAGPYRF